MDFDKNGMINYLEFTTAAMKKDLCQKEEYLKSAFQMFDQDRNSFIEVEELKQMFQGVQDDFQIEQSHSTISRSMSYQARDSQVPDHVWLEMLAEADVNKDGRISYDEFCRQILQLVRRKLNE